MTLTVRTQNEMIHFNDGQIQLIKNYLCKGITDDELGLFSAVCKKSGLDPFAKQIYPVKRNNSKTGTSEMTIQTSIDGYRLIADRSGRYCPGRESTYQYDKEGRVISATSYVKKQTADGTWHEVAVSAYISEYKPKYQNNFWDTKPHIMLAKCAEALALRKAFPNELSGLYTDDEMDQAANKMQPIASNEISVKATIAPAIEAAPSPVSSEKYDELSELFDLCSKDYQSKFNEWMSSTLKIMSLAELEDKDYERIRSVLTKKAEENQEYVNSMEGVSNEAKSA